MRIRRAFAQPACLRWACFRAGAARAAEPLRHLYDLHHTYATFALRAGVSVFAVSRFMGSSIAMIDDHYGHLARDSREHAVSLLDALAIERVVDAGWTPQQRAARPFSNRDSSPRRKRSRRVVDVRWTSRPKNRRLTCKQKELNCRNFLKPSDGLEPSTPSLPLRGFRRPAICCCLPLVAPAGLHKRSIPSSAGRSLCWQLAPGIAVTA